MVPMQSISNTKSAQPRVSDAQIIAFVRRFIAEHGYPPTMREIMAGIGLRSTSAVSYRLSRLEERGHIERDAAVPRGIRLTQQAKV